MSSAEGPLANRLGDKMFSAMDKSADEVAKYSGKEDLSEIDMIKFNMAASRYSMMSQLTSGLVKNLTDNEKQIAQKM